MHNSCVANVGCRVAVLLVASSLFLGCSGSTTSGPKTVAVTGKVTYKGAPVDKANVSFLGDGKIQAARAVTDKNGEFVLTTSEPGDGAVAGTHQVIVMKTVGSLTKPAAPAATGVGSMEAAAKAATSGTAEGEPAITHLLPEKYSVAATSGLSFTVEEGKKNHFEITLTD